MKLTYASKIRKPYAVRIALPDRRHAIGYRLEYRFFDSYEEREVWIKRNSYLFYRTSYVPSGLPCTSAVHYFGYTVIDFS